VPLTVSYVGHSVLEDATVLLAVTETTSARRWFRTVETSRSLVYALRAGSWWGPAGERVPTGPLALKLAELAMHHVVIASSVDRAVGM
jgi:hypothetical protein